MIESGSSGSEQQPAGGHRAWATVVVAIALVVAVCPATASAGGEAASSSPASDGLTVSVPRRESGLLRVAVGDSIDDAKLLRGWIEERNAGVVETIPEVEGHEQWIAVAVSGSTYEYRVWVVGMRDGVPVGVVEDADACACNTETLLALVDERVAEQVTVLREVSGGEVRVPPPVPLEPGNGVAQGVAKQPGQPDRPLRLHAMGYTGIGASVLGVGMLAAGIPLARTRATGNGVQGATKTRPWRPGIALAGVGGIVVAAGISLLVVDLVRQRPLAIAVVPTLEQRHFGVAITWRARGRIRG